MTPLPPDVQAALVEEMARRIHDVTYGCLSDDDWAAELQNYREKCERFPGYVKGRSVMGDCFRSARLAYTAALPVIRKAVLEEAALEADAEATKTNGICAGRIASAIRALAGEAR